MYFGASAHMQLTINLQFKIKEMIYYFITIPIPFSIY